MEKRQEEIDRLLQLPQEGDVWQFGLRQFHDWVYLAGKAWQPWMIAVFSLTHRSAVRSFPFHIDLPTQDFLWSMIVGAVRTPYPPLLPHRPTELQVQDDAIGHSLKPWVERLGITVVLKDKMEAVEKSLFEAGEEFYGPRSKSRDEDKSEQPDMNRFFTKQQVVSEYHLAVRLQAELFGAVQPIEQDDHGEPLYLEAHLDRWLAERFGAGQMPASSNEPFMTIRETAALLRCSYCEARERMLDGRIRTIRDGRWLRTRREWIEAYIAEKTIKAARDEPGMYTVPDPPRRRQGHIKFKKGDAGYRFLEKLRELEEKEKRP